jgi:hypothetical protein
MDRQRTLLKLMLAFSLLFGAAFSCGRSNRPGGGDSSVDVDAGNSASLPNLVSTNWSEISLTKKGEQEYQAGTYPNLQFCRDGSWAIHSYGGSDQYELQGGKYQIRGNRVIMNNEDGSSFGDFHLTSRTEEELVLESTDGYVLRLKYLGPVKC